MRIARGALLLAAAIGLPVSAGVAAAQSLEVRNGTPGTPVELVVGSTPAGSAAVDRIGDATVPIPLPEGRTELVVRVLVDACTGFQRVVLVESIVAAPPAEACRRSEIEGLFVIRERTTIVVDVSGERPNLRLRQGPAPDWWFRPGVTGPPPFESPTGLVLSATGSVMWLEEPRLDACAAVVPCTGQSRIYGYGGGAAYWITDYLGAGVQYLRPSTLSIRGGRGPGTATFEFTSDVRIEDVAVLTAMGGVPIGRTRIYGFVGPNRHRSTTLMTQTMDELTVTVDGQAVVIPGGSQTTMHKTTGIGVTAGGGTEVWPSPRLAIYGEAGFHFLRGEDVDGAGIRFDHQMPFVQVGVRLRVF